MRLRHWFYLSQLSLTLGLMPLCAQSSQKVAQIKLEQFGWQRLPLPAQREEKPTEENLMGVDFQGRVLIGYPAREDTNLTTRGNPKLIFHVLRFTSEGNLDLSASLPTGSFSDNAVFLDAHDHVLVVADEMLQLLIGDDQTPAQQRTWRPLSPCSWSQRCRIAQSHTRRILFVGQCQILDPECEQPVYDTSLSEPQAVSGCAWRGGATTDKFGYNWGWADGYFTRRYALCGPYLPQKLPVHDHVWAVLNEDSFVTAGGNGKRWKLGVDAGDGHSKFQHQLPKHDMPSMAIQFVKGDASGGRFAMVIDTLRGENRALDIGGRVAARRVVVYSSDYGVQLASVDVYPPVPHGGVAFGIVPGFTFDLSPDGHVLAVLSEGVVTVVRMQ